MITIGKIRELICQFESITGSRPSGILMTKFDYDLIRSELLMGTVSMGWNTPSSREYKEGGLLFGLPIKLSDKTTLY